MPRAPSVRPLLIVVAALLVTALLPLRWLWWVSDVAAIVALPLAPLNDGSNALRAWLRPGDDPLRGASASEAQLRIELDTYRALWHGERLANEELLQRLEDARLAEQFHRGSIFDPIRADVVGRRPDGRRGPLRINVGASAGVAAGDVAVFRGAHIVGRVMPEVDRLTSLLLPIHDPGIGRLHAAVWKEPEPDVPNPGVVRVLLTPEGDGTFSADAAQDSGVRLGDQVVLDDPDWPDTARGMIVGLVDAIDRRDDQPLRVRLRVRPLYDLHELRSVVVKVHPNGPGGSLGDAPGGDGARSDPP